MMFCRKIISAILIFSLTASNFISNTPFHKNFLAPKTQTVEIPKEKSIFQTLDQALPRSYVANAVVVAAMGLLFYSAGLISPTQAAGFGGWLWVILNTSFNYVFFACLMDTLVKRTEKKEISAKSLASAAKIGLINGNITLLFFAMLNFSLYGSIAACVLFVPVYFKYFKKEKKLKKDKRMVWGTLTLFLLCIPFVGIWPAVVRAVLISFVLVYIRQFVHDKLFHIENKKKEEGGIKKRSEQAIWLSRNMAVTKNVIVQSLPFAMRGPAEAVFNYLFQAYLVGAPHQTRLKSLIRRPHWVRAIQRTVRFRGPAIMIYSVPALPLFLAEYVWRRGKIYQRLSRPNFVNPVLFEGSL